MGGRGSGWGRGSGGGGGLGERQGAGDISSKLPYTALSHGALLWRDFEQQLTTSCSRLISWVFQLITHK